MSKLVRFQENPIVLPSSTNEWERNGAFNPSVTYDHGTYHMVYRALSSKKEYKGERMEVSTVGYAKSRDGLRFTNNKLLIAPEKSWERFGCEDPRVVKVGDEFFIFYTALSSYPFGADGIKVAVAITRDFSTITERHLVTPFNAKAMTLFPRKIKGKLVGILAANTDRPPSRIGLAFFDKKEDIWSPVFWQDWYDELDSHALFLNRDAQDHVEVGAGPVLTKKGWLLVYSHIQNYFSSPRIFGIEAVLLDTNDPAKIIGRTKDALLAPEKPYELLGNVPNITFPTGALIRGNTVSVYYGGADTVGCVATMPLQKLLTDITFS